MLAGLAGTVLSLLPGLAAAQNVGIGTAAPHAKAALDISATDKGLLIPRLDSAQRTGISAPPDGLMVFQKDGRKGFWYAVGGQWVYIPDKTRAGDNLGSHTATQALNLQAHALTGSGASIGGVGVGVRADGGLNLGQYTAGNAINLGYQAGQANLYGSGNVLLGYQSGMNSVVGGFNVFSGYRSGYANTDGSKNVFSGYEAGFSNLGGDNNVFIGYRSGYANTAGRFNVFVGFASGYTNTSGNENLFSGYETGRSNLGGSRNMFVGFRSGYYNESGDENQFEGYNSGRNNVSGIQTLFCGLNSGILNVTGSYNTALGYEAGPSVDGLSNAAAIGHRARVSQSNALVLGGTGFYAVNVGIGTTSPQRKLDVAGSIRQTTYALPAAQTVAAGSTSSYLWTHNLGYRPTLLLTPEQTSGPGAGAVALSYQHIDDNSLRIYSYNTGSASATFLVRWIRVD